MIHPDTTPQKDAVFIESYFNSGDAVAACVEAGIQMVEWPVTIVAKAMLDRVEIQAAIATLKRLRKDGVTSQQITRDSIVADMQSLFETWKAVDPKAALAAKRLQAELLSLLDKNININVKHSADQMSEAQLMAIINQKPIDGEYTDVTDVPKVTLGKLSAS